MKKALATTIATGLLGAAMITGAPAASAQQAVPTTAPVAGVPGPGYSGTVSRTFVGAAKQVARATAGYAPRIHGAQRKPEQQAIIEDADATTTRAAQPAGPGVDKFLAINHAVQQ